MSPEEFVAGLRSDVIDNNLTIYKRLFSENTPEDATDPYWKRALALFMKLDPEDQAVLFEIIRETMVATTSTVLGVLDGVNSVNQRFVRFSVADDRGNRLSGDLQDLFLQQEQEAAGEE
jgi:hypothetical protein